MDIDPKSPLLNIKPKFRSIPIPTFLNLNSEPRRCIERGLRIILTPPLPTARSTSQIQRFDLISIICNYRCLRIINYPIRQSNFRRIPIFLGQLCIRISRTLVETIITASMSLLNQLFNRGVLGPKCKTCLNLAISRIKLLQNKRDVQLKHMRKEIAQFLNAGQEPIARIRVEHVIREQNIWEAYEILEMFCEFILARVPILETQRECPPELREAVASVIFAAPRCSDLPDLLQIRNLFAAKYGKEFIAAATELRPDTSVNRTIIEKLSITTPSAESRLSLLKAIAQEHNVEWDSSRTEAEFSKKPEDLLNGPKEICSESIVNHPHPAPKPSEKSDNSQNPKKVNERLGEIEEERRKPSSSQVLEKARAAMASADRASVAARAAADLVNLQFGSFKLQQERNNALNSST